jgi:DNA-binding response OmpR family regulator
MIRILISEIIWRRDRHLIDYFSAQQDVKFVLFDTPNQAIRVLETDKNIDLILVAPEDIQYTKIDFLNFVRTSVRYCWIPIILLGRSMDADFIRYCFENGVNDILSEPVSENVFIARIFLAACSGRRRVLIVDDDETVLKVLKTCLEMERYIVFAASSADDIFKVFNTETIHAAIIDFMLKNTNGLQLLADIKKLSPLLPVIVITGHTGLCSKEKAIAAGADAYFAKPFNNSELVNALRRIFGLKSFYGQGHFMETVSTESVIE